MYLTKVPDQKGDDYFVHQHLMTLFDGQRILFQRKGFEIDVLSPKPIHESLDISQTIDAAHEGDTMLFTLRINPVTTKFIAGKNRRIALPPAKVSPWLEGIFKKHGFTAEFAVKNEGCRCSKKNGKTITLFSVLVTGVLKISNPELFKTAVQNGIGHGKGLGFGLLNVFNFL